VGDGGEPIVSGTCADAAGAIDAPPADPRTVTLSEPPNVLAAGSEAAARGGCP
jgi:hypothetical protein